MGRTFTSMPPIAYDLEDNPVFKALRRKERQLSGVSPNTLKCIFLGDAGCGMLRDLTPFGASHVSGKQVIHHFLGRSSVDIVCVFSPCRDQLFSHGQDTPQWKVTLFRHDESQSQAEYEQLNRMMAALPKPRLEGYQARSWHEQGMFDPQGRGIYGGCSMSSKNSSVSMSLSARLVLEFLAGRISPEQFQHFAFGDGHNLLDFQFRRGMTLQSIRIEKGGVDSDDDQFILELDGDWAASPLRLPETAA